MGQQRLRAVVDRDWIDQIWRRHLRALQIVEIDQAAAQLEGASEGVVLVLDPQLGANPRRPRPVRSDASFVVAEALPITGLRTFSV